MRYGPPPPTDRRKNQWSANRVSSHISSSAVEIHDIARNAKFKDI